MPFKKIIIFILTLTLALNVSARQKTADLGLFGGVAVPITDYSSIYFFQSIKPAAGIFYRYNFNTRYSVRVNGIFGTVGATGYLDNPDVLLSFNKTVADFSTLFEINYLDYALGVKNMSFSPYVFYGLGMSFYTGANNQAIITPNIPFGLGIKWSIAKRVGVGLEFSMRKLFNDELDNLDNPYSGLNLVEVNDLYHNNDWINYFGLTLTYKFFRGKKPCPAFN